jgi:hypothetical protein
MGTFSREKNKENLLIEESIEVNSQKGHIKIDWGRQGSVILAYLIVFLVYFGIIANTMMFNILGEWISLAEMDRTLLVWTYKAYGQFYILAGNFELPIFILVFLVFPVIIIVYILLNKCHLPVLIALLSTFFIVLIIVYFLFYSCFTLSPSPIFCTFLGNTATFEIAELNSVFSLVFLFLVCFLLTYKEDIPHYGIKASLWLVPFIIIQGLIFYWIMYGIMLNIDPFPALEPLILQFAYWEGYFNVIILFVITLSGALSGMKIKQFIVLRQKSD